MDVLGLHQEKNPTKNLKLVFFQPAQEVSSSLVSVRWSCFNAYLGQSILNFGEWKEDTETRGNYSLKKSICLLSLAREEEEVLLVCLVVVFFPQW